MESLKEQVGGNHYKEMKIQPLEFIMANNIPYCEANIIKYVCRYKSKNGLQDLLKARHYLDILIEHHREEFEKRKQALIELTQDEPYERTTENGNSEEGSGTGGTL